MILPMYIFGQSVLRQKAEDINTDYPNLQELISNMFETLKSSCSLSVQYFIAF